MPLSFSALTPFLFKAGRCGGFKERRGWILRVNHSASPRHLGGESMDSKSCEGMEIERLKARVAELEAECRDLRPAPHLLESAEQECGELRTENVRLRAALDRYGVHEDGCEAMHEPDNEPRHPRCDCGLSAELR